MSLGVLQLEEENKLSSVNTPTGYEAKLTLSLIQITTALTSASHVNIVYVTFIHNLSLMVSNMCCSRSETLPVQVLQISMCC